MLTKVSSIDVEEIFFATEMKVMTAFTVANMTSTVRKMSLTLNATGRTGVAGENQKVGLLKASFKILCSQIQYGSFVKKSSYIL